MEKSVAVFELNKITRQRNLSIIAGVVLLITSFIQTIIIFRGERSVVLVPSSLSGEVSLSNKRVSSAY